MFKPDIHEYDSRLVDAIYFLPTCTQMRILGKMPGGYGLPSQRVYEILKETHRTPPCGDDQCVNKENPSPNLCSHHWVPCFSPRCK